MLGARSAGHTEESSASRGSADPEPPQGDYNLMTHEGPRAWAAN
jgi:hypothetical protein